MKKILFLAMVLLSSLVATSKTTVIVNGDTTVISRQADSAMVTAVGEAAVAAGEAVNEALDDTVFDSEDWDGEWHSETDEHIALASMHTAQMIAAWMVIGTIFVTFLVLLFYYLNRRRKYKMIERAIEQGYPLPPELLGAHPVQQHNIYITPAAQQAGRQAPAQPQAQPSSAVAGGTPQARAIPMGQPLSLWQTYRGGIVTTIVGFSLMLFFVAADAAPMVALMSIVLLIGLAKIFFTFQQQRNLTTIYHQSTQVPPQQPAAQQPGTVAPPPFDPQRPASQPEPEQPAAQSPAENEKP